MAAKFQELAQTDAVRRAQEYYYGKSQQLRTGPERDLLSHDEITFIQARDSFYMATVSETGWPYIQHRGGPMGFLHVLGPSALAFADYKGNRQLLSTGNLSASDRVALFLMDYPQQTRLKIMGHVRIEDARNHRELARQLAGPGVETIVERLFFIDVISFDWNCPQHITPRYSATEVEEIIAPLRARLVELEAHLKGPT
jgi:predicted pyridoxine 5'-phosphate oxidase superfamily flavin-nucleotide-binding protein